MTRTNATQTPQTEQTYADVANDATRAITNLYDLAAALSKSRRYKQASELRTYAAALSVTLGIASAQIERLQAERDTYLIALRAADDIMTDQRQLQAYYEAHGHYPDQPCYCYASDAPEAVTEPAPMHAVSMPEDDDVLSLDEYAANAPDLCSYCAGAGCGHCNYSGLD